MRFLITITIAVVTLVGFMACGDDSSTNVTPPPGSDHRKVVEMRDNNFSPKDLVVAVGDTVDWVNVGANTHTTTSGAGCAADGIWNSGSLGSGGTFRAIFDASHITQTGTLPYFCIPHCAMGMTGTITVNP